MAENVCDHPLGLYFGTEMHCPKCGEKNVMHEDYIAFDNRCPRCGGCGFLCETGIIEGVPGIFPRGLRFQCDRCKGGTVGMPVRAVHRGHGLIGAGTQGIGATEELARAQLLRNITAAHCVRCGALLAFDDHEDWCPVRIALNEATDSALDLAKDIP